MSGPGASGRGNECIRQGADDSSLLLLPTAVGTSNDQKKQKIKAFHYKLAHGYSFETTGDKF